MDLGPHVSLPQSCARRAIFATSMRKMDPARLHEVRQLQCGVFEGAACWHKWRGLQQVRDERADSQGFEARDGGTLAGPFGVRGCRQSRDEFVWRHEAPSGARRHAEGSGPRARQSRRDFGCGDQLHGEGLAHPGEQQRRSGVSTAPVLKNRARRSDRDAVE